MAAVKSIDGKIEALGQSILMGSLGVRYTVIRFVTADGQTTSLKEVIADNEIDLYLKLGQKGRFCFYTKGRPILCGFRGDHRTHITQESDDPLLHFERQERKLWWIILILSIALSAVLIGIPGVLYSAWKLYSLRNARPKTDVIAAALDHGGESGT